MEYLKKRKPLPTTPAKLTDPGEAARLLRQYAGIFPNNVKEFAEKVIPKFRRKTNFAR